MAIPPGQDLNNMMIAYKFTTSTTLLGSTFSTGLTPLLANDAVFSYSGLVADMWVHFEFECMCAWYLVQAKHA